MIGLTLLLAGGAAVLAAAAVPPGPRIGYVSVRHGGNDVRTAGSDGGSRQVVIGASVLGFAEPNVLAWSPDGTTLALDEGSENFDIYLASPDGTGLRRLTNLGDAEDPVFSSDGRTLYFDRVKFKSLPDGDSTIAGSAIWAIGSDGSGLRQLTALRRKRFDFPASASPAGDQLAFTRSVCRIRHHAFRCGVAARLLSPSTGEQQVLARRASQPVFSPDGTKISLASYRDHNGEVQTGEDETAPASELYVLDRADGGMRRLTRTRGIDEGGSSWDPSGQRIAFERYGPRFAERINEVNADGSCLRLLLGHARVPAWQPGPGREAGPIAC